RRQQPGGLSRVVQAYLQHLEVVLRDFTANRSTARQIKDLAAYLHQELGFAAVCVYTRKKSGFAVTDTFGITRQAVSKIRITGRGGLIKTLETRQEVMTLKQAYADAPGDNPFASQPLYHVVPLLTAGKCNHLILLSDNTNISFKLLRPFLLALADQIGGYKRIEDARTRHGQQIEKLKKQIKLLSQEIERNRSRPVSGVRTIVAAQNRLIGIFNRDQLFLALIELFRQEFDADRLSIFLPDRKSGDHVLKYQLAGIVTEENPPRLKGDSPLFELLRRATAVVPLENLGKTLMHESAVDTLRNLGADMVTLLSDEKGERVLVGIGRRRRRFSETETEITHSFCTLFELVLANLGHFEKIEELSHTDPMTGLYNYRYFYKRLQEEILRAKRFSRHLALAIFDIDEFKVFNDTYGHQAGDYLLEQLGKLLAVSVRTMDVVSRYGGEEFCIIMPEADAENCRNFMERMRVTILNHQFADKFTDGHHEITVSLGGAIYPNDAQRVDRLIYCADMALLKAKSSGRNKMFMYEKSLTEKKQIL
ncbi:MAG: GGDEF domain-containing protein, partial [candidate division Zixibacteria bacterium]|nr:GGDEF domain-containing protein [candidate division Zixibacteria bacterium]